MKKVAELLNAMRDAGIISDYALFGAAAQMRYTEAVATLDADILVAVPATDRLDILSPIYAFCTKAGYHPEGEAIRVGAWPVQFMPVFSPLTEAAMREADTADFDGVPLRVVRADYLAVLALSVGRAKDFARILALIESGSVTPVRLEELSLAYGLYDAWIRYKARFMDE
jgi:hypothetical protein